METTLLNEVKEKLEGRFNNGILLSEQLYDYPVFTVKKEITHELLKFLKDELGYHFLTTMCGLHFPDNKGQELGVMYQLHNMPQNKRIRIKTFFDLKDAQIPTVTDIFRTANWMERETYDFFGIEFKGHPNLKRILNMDELIGWPMRKEFPLEDQYREDKDNTMFGR